MARTALAARLRPHLAAAPGFIAVTLFLIWGVHDGGYDADTWYWGALVLLFAGGATALGLGSRLRLTRHAAIALAAFALYVAWSYLSISWSSSPGDALQGSNRALLYLLAFGLMMALPWTPEAALAALVVFALGVGTIAVVLLVRLASGDHVSRLVIEGRLAAPTGYFNATAALFTVEALLGIALAARRELPILLRGLLISLACAGLQLALIVQSRGWLFTLPLVAIAAIVLVPDRLRVLAAAVLPVVAVLVPLRRLLHVYQTSSGHALTHAAIPAGKASLEICAGMLIAATMIAGGERLLRPRPLQRRQRRALGTALAVVVTALAVGGGVAATHGHPFRFISRQWNGFSNPNGAGSSQSHFFYVGSGRYDFWRVSLDAYLAHPVGGLGQDNFDDYYVRHRRTAEEPKWVHSLEFRLLAHTGLVGLLLFAVFVVAAIAGAVSNWRRANDLRRGVAGAALLPLVVWLIHGSVDWFWEIPALSGPALGFLGMAVGLSATVRSGTSARPSGGRGPAAAALIYTTAACAFAAAFVALLLPYMSVREVSNASNLEARDPAAALRDLAKAADLNPLDPNPDRIAGTLALRLGSYAQAQRRFDRSISREPGAWFSWLGAGLAASELGKTTVAHHDFAVAASINSLQPAVTKALAHVYSRHPLTPTEAFRWLVFVT